VCKIWSKIPNRFGKIPENPQKGDVFFLCALLLAAGRVCFRSAVFFSVDCCQLLLLLILDSVDAARYRALNGATHASSTQG